MISQSILIMKVANIFCQFSSNSLDFFYISRLSFKSWLANHITIFKMWFDLGEIKAILFKNVNVQLIIPKVWLAFLTALSI